MSLRCSLKRSSPGTPFLESATSAFCVACGNATCSAACHTRFFEHSSKCTFHNHFLEGSPVIQMRSLTRQNIEFGEKKKLAVGTLLNRTSRSYLFGMVHPEPGKLYAQRGYRQYGDLTVG